MGEHRSAFGAECFEFGQNVRRRSGLFGSGNDEYLYPRCAASSA
jgi:hypothetical protein